MSTFIPTYILYVNSEDFSIFQPNGNKNHVFFKLNSGWQSAEFLGGF